MENSGCLASDFSEQACDLERVVAASLLKRPQTGSISLILLQFVSAKASNFTLQAALSFYPVLGTEMSEGWFVPRS